MPDDNKHGRARDSIANTIFVAIGVSLVCSVLVSAAAVILRPLQEQNQNEFRQRIVLEVAGLFEPGADTDALFENIDVRLVELETGEYVEDRDPVTFDAVAAANDPELSIAVPDELDIAKIRRRPIHVPVYLVQKLGEVQQIILPVYGAGLWSTMRGYLALEPDGNTVLGLRFYEHAETPGLGDQIDKETWLQQWPGKVLYDNARNTRIRVVRGQAQKGPDALYEVDGLSGATLTGNGVTNLIRYWTGPHGFGPYLERIASEARSDG